MTNLRSLSNLAVILCAMLLPVSSALTNQKHEVSSRRGFFWNSAGLVSAAIIAEQQQQPAFAVSQDQKDRENILKGYNRLQYLLANWEKETTVCKTGQETTWGDKCERTPLKVMEYLGFRSTTDPLYQADKTLMRLMSSAPSDKEVEYMDAMELFAEKAEEASSMAFVSSWGEANPGGGKDRVELFIERAKKQVIDSRDSLETVMKILDIKY